MPANSSPPPAAMGIFLFPSLLPPCTKEEAKARKHPPKKPAETHSTFRHPSCSSQKSVVFPAGQMPAPPRSRYRCPIKSHRGGNESGRREQLETDQRSRRKSHMPLFVTCRNPHRSKPFCVSSEGWILWRQFGITIALGDVSGERSRASKEMVQSSNVLQDYFSGHLRTVSYFDYRTLRKATRNFDPKDQLGRGGFGPVYKGTLDDGRVVAVKRLSFEKSQQGESEFLAEVRVITNIQHKNLVRLMGCCSNGTQRLLVYEYMKNRSLDRVLYGTSCTFLSWEIRVQIILGIARGLQGYTAPEYAMRGELSEKADIYSFGVLVLEIISSRRNTDLTLPPEMQYLPAYAWKLFEGSKVLELVDPKLQADGVAENDILKVCHVAFLCLQLHPALRPPMSEIVAMLTCKNEPTAIPLKPTFLLPGRQYDQTQSWESISKILFSPLQEFSASTPDNVSHAWESGFM
ncbi:hypothetical protein Taro_014739 [Colocasia esculenta]|uniref:Protein kinase domain-containing protein n=1 Tax=Colocasia esculenta TaxID=4460 RepID=A0A843U9S6_COLES|nr:hypothetical protein [Colocasia esculenta]